MENLQSKIWIRINAIEHAFSGEIGCACWRCQTINFSMTKPTGKLEEFLGWDDPPWQVHTALEVAHSGIEGRAILGSKTSF